jgi:MOSC domain-containing protein YiiM
MAAITELCVYTEKHGPGLPVAEARLVAGRGMEGDVHADGGERQLCLYPLEIKQRLDAQTGQGLCIKRFKGNIMFKGLDADCLVPGRVLRAGQAELEISKQVKRCFPECQAEPAACPLKGKSFFAKVTKSGLVRCGQEIYSKKSL